MKPGTRTTSLILTLAVICALTAVATLIYRPMADRISLIGANDNERILNTLLAGLRNHDNFGSTIASSEFLSDRVSGVAVYRDDGSSLYSWGSAPARFDASGIDKWGTDADGRYLVPNRKDSSFTYIVRTSRMAPPPPHDKPDYQPGTAGSDAGASRSAETRRPPSFFFDVLGKGEWLYVDIRHVDYWRTLTLMNIVFPLSVVLVSILAFFVRNLVIRNGEYRDRIEKQKNLVVLGTAASTLAHEIKNPLLAIRLQTGILKKMYPDVGVQELDIINAEIDRLSALTYRINDYLREPKGNPEDLDAARFVREVATGLCGRDPVRVEADSVFAVSIDRERFRSVLENIVRNALESGGPASEIAVEISRVDGMVCIDVGDRGRGIGESEAKRLFEPFFTTKSRGTGIGLVISRRFIEAAGGSLGLAPREGGGTTVRILIPETGRSK